MSTTVVLDAWHLAGASANRGIGTYLRGVLPHLADDADLDLVALAVAPDPLPRGVGHRRISRRAPGRYAQREHDLRLPFDLRRAARAVGADVFFSPADNPPSRSPVPWVQMLHDLIPLVVPGSEGAADRWRRIGERLTSAAAVVTNSGCTADDAVRLLGVDPGATHVVPLGVSPRFRPPASPAAAGPPTILYVGEYGPHKGFAEAFAVAGAVAQAGLPHRLAMVGHLAPWYEPSVRDLLRAAPSPDRVDLLGYVDDVVAAYQEADALIVTSRYEGFCLPALEAMACGTPVVAFANSALPEVVGEAGVLVPDGDVPAFAAAVVELLEDEEARASMAVRGIERAASFTWEGCARAHAELFRRVGS